MMKGESTKDGWMDVGTIGCDVGGYALGWMGPSRPHH